MPFQVIDSSGGQLSTSQGALDLPYVVVNLAAGLTAERALTGTSNQVTVTDGGANGSVTLATPQNINAGASVTFAQLTVSGLASVNDVLSVANVLSSSRNAFFLARYGVEASMTGEIRFQEAQGGSNFVGFKAPSAALNDLAWQLPDHIGTSGQVLATLGTDGSGSGKLYWATTGGGGAGTSNAVAGGGASNLLAHWVGGASIGSDPDFSVDGASLLTNVLGIRGGSIVTGISCDIHVVPGNSRNLNLDIQGSGLLRVNASTFIVNRNLGAVGINVDTVDQAFVCKPLGTGASFRIRSGGNLGQVIFDAGGTTGGGNYIRVAQNLIPDSNASHNLGIDTLGWGEVHGEIYYDTDGLASYINIGSSSTAIAVGGSAGIGTNNPSYKLHVIGDIWSQRFTSSCRAGLDLRSWGTESSATGEGRFYEQVANGSNFVGLKAPSAILNDTIWRLPDHPGTSGQVLATLGDNASGGNLYWATTGGGGGTGALTNVSTRDITVAQSAVDFTGLDNTYREYIIVLKDVTACTNSQRFHMYSSSDNGTNYNTGASSYVWVYESMKSNINTPQITRTEGSTAIQLTKEHSNASYGGMNGEIRLYNFPGGRRKHATWTLMNPDSTAAEVAVANRGTVSIYGTTSVNAIRLRFDAGNIGSGSLILYGAS